MARTTVAALLERLEALEAEVEELRSHVHSTPTVQLVAQVSPPRPVSQPLDVLGMSYDASSYWAYYYEDDTWGATAYL